MPAIVSRDLGGGSAEISIVEDSLWKQIMEVFNSNLLEAEDKEWIINWLTSSNKDYVRPKCAPWLERNGCVIRTYYAQSYIPGEVNLNGIIGFIMV